MQQNWNFLWGEGWGVQNKIPSVGEYGYFLELHNLDAFKGHSLSLFFIHLIFLQFQNSGSAEMNITF